MAIGVIGGPDGPTSVYITPVFNWINVIYTLIVILVVSGLIIWLVRKNKKSKR